MKRCKQEQEKGTSVTVQVDVTKIVRYLCMTGIFVVGIISLNKFICNMSYFFVVRIRDGLKSFCFWRRILNHGEI